MKREKLPVILTAPNGTTYTLGTVSRVTTSCLAGFMRREGFKAAKEHGAPGGSWVRLPGAGVCYVWEGWTVHITPRSKAATP